MTGAEVAAALGPWTGARIEDGRGGVARLAAVRVDADCCSFLAPLHVIGDRLSVRLRNWTISGDPLVDDTVTLRGADGAFARLTRV